MFQYTCRYYLKDTSFGSISSVWESNQNNRVGIVGYDKIASSSLVTSIRLSIYNYLIWPSVSSWVASLGAIPGSCTRTRSSSPSLLGPLLTHSSTSIAWDLSDLHFKCPWKTSNPTLTVAKIKWISTFKKHLKVKLRLKSLCVHNLLETE